jgi:hypothetical protein
MRREDWYQHDGCILASRPVSVPPGEDLTLRVSSSHRNF